MAHTSESHRQERIALIDRQVLQRQVGDVIRLYIVDEAGCDDSAIEQIFEKHEQWGDKQKLALNGFDSHKFKLRHFSQLV
jgi:hypothetical protein